ncbi:MAG: VOC family protein [Nocardioidaceae bacterium]
MGSVSVRYIVDDVAEAVAFYTVHLGFEVDMQPGPGFAALQRGDVRLLLNQPGVGGAGQDFGDATPTPGGWNRFRLEQDDVEATVAALRWAGVTVRGDVVTGRGGLQAIIEDPSGNPVELFQPHR